MRWHAQLVWAQVSANPSTEGLPGVEFVQKILDWGMQIALWGSLAAMLFGAALWGLAERGATAIRRAPASRWLRAASSARWWRPWRRSS